MRAAVTTTGARVVMFMRRTRKVTGRIRHPADVWLLSRMIGWALALTVLKRVVQLQSLVRLVHRPSDGHPRRMAQEDQVMTFAQWASGVSRWTKRGRCLERGLVAYRYLTRINAQPSLVVGFAHDGAQTSGHVWVVLDGRIAGEAVAAVDAFAPMVMFGPDGSTLH